MEVDLGEEVRRRNVALTERARRRIEGDAEGERAAEGGRAGRKGRVGGRNRRGSDDVKRDQLVEQFLHENRRTWEPLVPFLSPTPNTKTNTPKSRPQHPHRRSPPAPHAPLRHPRRRSHSRGVPARVPRRRRQPPPEAPRRQARAPPRRQARRGRRAQGAQAGRQQEREVHGEGHTAAAGEGQGEGARGRGEEVRGSFSWLYYYYYYFTDASCHGRSLRGYVFNGASEFKTIRFIHSSLSSRHGAYAAWAHMCKRRRRSSTR